LNFSPEPGLRNEQLTAGKRVIKGHLPTFPEKKAQPMPVHPKGFSVNPSVWRKRTGAKLRLYVSASALIHSCL